MVSRRFRTRKPRHCFQPAEVLEQRTLLAAVVDSISIDGSAPEVLGEVNGVELLALSDDDATRIFASNGTQAGTAEISDIAITEITHVQVVGQNMFLAGSNGLQTDLWRVNNEPGGAVLVKSDISLDPSSDDNFATLNDEIYFAAEADDQTVGNELFKSDGGAAELVADVFPGVQPKSLNLPSDRGVEFEIWVNELDPETGETIQSRVIHEFNVPAADTYEVVLSDGYYRFWIRPTNSEGEVGAWSSSRTFSVFGNVSEGDPGAFTVFNDEVYFAAENSDGIRTLWKSNGTSAGTVQVNPQVFEDQSTFDGGPRDFVEFDGQLFFSTRDELFRTDGTTVTHVDLGLLDGGLPAKMTAIGVVNERLFVAETPRFSNDGDTIAVHVLTSATDVTPEELHRIPQHVRVNGFVSWNRLDSFAVINEELVFLSVEHESAHSYNLSPSDDRHFPSSVPRYLFRKRGTWYASNGTTDGTRSLPSDGYTYAEDDPFQLQSDFTQNDTEPLGNSRLLIATDTTVFTDSNIRRVAQSDQTAVLNDTALTAHSSIYSATPGRVREENVSLEDVTAVATIADKFWVSAADGDGRALFQIDLDTNDQPGPQITGFDIQNVPGTGLSAIEPAGSLNFSWSDQNGPTFDLVIRRVSYPLGNGSSLESLQSTDLTSYERHFDPGSYRIQVRSYLSDGTFSQWSEIFLQVSEPENAGPMILTTIESDAVVYDSVPLTWVADPEAVSYELQSAAGLTAGITGTSTNAVPGPGPTSFSVRSRYADGTVSRWSDPLEVYAIPAPVITNVQSTGSFVHATLLPTDEIRAIYFDVMDASTDTRVAEGAVGLVRQNNQFHFRLPYSGRFRVEVHTVLRRTGSDYYSSLGEHIFDAQVNEDTAPDLTDSDVRLLDGHGIQTTTRPFFRWEAPATDSELSHYELLLAGESHTYRRTNIRPTSFTTDADLPAGRYRIFVRVHFANGGATPWNYHQGVLELQPVVAGPPRITAPSNTVFASDVIFEWTSDSAASHYEVWLSTDTENAPVIHERQVENNTLTPTSNLAAGRYRLWVRTHYADGSTSFWTHTYPFTVVDDDIVQVTSGIGLQPQGRQTIGWDAISGATTYELYVNEVSTRHTPTYHRRAISGTSFQIAASLEPGKSYEIWVRAHLANGGRTRWGNDPPILTVESGITALRPILSVNDNTASWTNILGAVRYEVWVNEVDPENPNRTIRARAFREFVTNVSQDMGLSSGSYRGWVRAIDDSGTASIWSEALTFSIS